MAEEESYRRSRREKKKSRASSALEKIRLSRQSGVKQEDELEKTDGIFEYVTEEEYSKIVKDRQSDQWIMDDDGTYREHGREMFDEEVNGAGSSKNSKSSSKHPSVKPSNDIKNMVLAMGGARKRRREGKESVSVKNDTVLSSILDQIRNKNKREVADHKPFVSRGGRGLNMSSELNDDSSTSLPFSRGPPPQKRITPSMPFKKVPKVKPRSPSPGPMAMDYDTQYSDLDPVNLWGGNETTEDDHQNNQKASDNPSVHSNDSKVLIKNEPSASSTSGTVDYNSTVVDNIMDTHDEDDDIMNEPIPEEAVSTSGWETVREELAEKAPPPPAVPDQEVDLKTLPLKEGENGDKVLEFYWLDMYEDSYKQPGTVYMFGKVRVNNGFISCCVTVQNIERCMHFLPRVKMLSKSGAPTDESVTMQALYNEFNAKYAEKFRLMRFSSKRVEKKYAFDLPDVPRQSEYLEVRYSADYPAPPPDASGRTFSRVFGTNTSSLERLVLACQLKGPCWLNIINPALPAQNISWCKIECTADSLSSVAMASEQAPPPPLTILSLSMKTILNARTKTNEVLCIGSLVHKDVFLDKPPSTPFQSEICAIRRPHDRNLPLKFQEYMEKKNIRVEISANERGLLAFFLAKIAKIDPDLIIGHNLSSQWLDVLQHRLSACKVPSWSRIGRLRRQVIPKSRTNAQYLCCGRLILDVKVSARELIRARSYDLSELVSTVLGDKCKYQPWEEEKVVGSFGSIESLSSLVTHTMDEALFSLRLTHELCVLPLAYQITCIVGNTLGRTLHGGRSERNEFLLLHAFTQKGYLPPDKLEKHKGTAPPTEDDEGGVVGVGKKNKSSYSGGLVLDPKVGFYNRLILLLDFNSLYPSIIQEYNICFTTVDHAHCTTDEDLVNLQLPGDSVEQGILPSEIRVLVERRREVKKLLKTATNPDQKQQYDIRQKALKLTANSMYGCLGFSNSRFYAKPLAAAITGQGREILMNTKELATKLGFDVIYGDTDSIMIDSGTHDIAEAEAVALKVKQEVNKLYRLLEIDIDGIFKCMLLLKKKKYAAISLVNKGGEWNEHRELKGLDIVRRDWCDLAKKAGMYVLDQILAGTDYDKLFAVIQDFLTKLSEDVKNNRTSLEDYIITKALTKLPKDYPDKKSLSHVQVAMRMVSRNEHVQPGDIVPYIVCEGSEAGLSNAQRAFHPKEVTKQQLTVDVQYYLQSQVHAVVSRLCEPIVGLDSAQLAQWLSLDPSLYAKRQLTTGDNKDDDSLTLGGVSLSAAEPLRVKCPNKECSHISEISDSSLPSFACVKCGGLFTQSHLSTTLVYAIRHYKSQYYRGVLECEDGHSTRSITFALNCRLCGRKVKESYSSGSLYGQFKFFSKLFKDPQHTNLKKVIDEQLSSDHNAYTHISLRHLFPKLRQ